MFCNLARGVSQANYCSTTINSYNDTNTTDEHEGESEVPSEESQICRRHRGCRI